MKDVIGSVILIVECIPLKGVKYRKNPTFSGISQILM
jgi:hypothetical protein